VRGPHITGSPARPVAVNREPSAPGWLRKDSITPVVQPPVLRPPEATDGELPPEDVIPEDVLPEDLLPPEEATP
jgi:hypothetical protein